MTQDVEIRLVSDRQLAKMLSLSRATIWRRAADGTLPGPVRVGGATRWRLEEIEAAIARLSENRHIGRAMPPEAG